MLNAFFVTFLANGLGYDLKLAGLLFALNQALSVAGRVVYGFIADAFGSPRPVLCGLSVLSAASAIAIACLGSGRSVAALIPEAAFSGILVATGNGLFMAEGGSYDLLMKCYLDDATDIGHFVTSRIQTLPGIKDTYTYITFKAFS